ncbi:MAG: S8 family serine peptidase [Candidatus Eisenbacteria bacterium]
MSSMRGGSMQRTLSILGILGLGLLETTLPGDAGAGRIHPVLQARIGAAGPSVEDRMAPRSETAPPSEAIVWVSFADRGFATEAARAEALRQAQERIGDEALARRAAVGAALADDADLPICPAYRRAVAAHGTIRHESRWLNAVSARVPVTEIAAIAALPFVLEVRPVARLASAGLGPERAPDGRLLERPDPSRRLRRPLGGVDDIYGPSRAQLDEIDVPAAHQEGYTGARVRVMMLDTGFRKDHDAFQQTDLLAERDFVFGDGDTQNEPEDDPSQHWHGTATWGACGGYAPGNLIGPAYGATFVLAKTEDVRSELPVEEDNYVAALEWGDSLGISSTSASLIYKDFDDGSGWDYAQLDGDTAPITRAIDRAAQRGILCVNAMGNSGPDLGSLGEPADADTMLACGAVSNENSIANFSSRGPTADGRTKPEVVARGVDTWCADANDTDTYTDASGTSLSTPLVGGSVALVLEAHPEWSVWQARRALISTADRHTHPDNDYGWGRIDVDAAIHYTPVLVPLPFSLQQPPDGSTTPTVRPTFVWNRSADPQGEVIRYEVWVDEEQDFGTPLVYSEIADTTWTLPVPLPPETLFYWRVIAEEPDGYRRLCRADFSFRTPQASGTDDLLPVVDGWRIEVSPNPWKAGAVLRWYAPPGSMSEMVRMTIFEATGRRLWRETRAVTHEGWNEMPFDLRGADGRDLPSGVYLALLEAHGRAARTKVILSR